MKELHVVMMTAEELQLVTLLVERHLDDLAGRVSSPNFYSIKKKMQQFEVILHNLGHVQERVGASV